MCSRGFEIFFRLVMNRIQFASVVRSYRLRNQLTPDAAAEKLGVSPRTIENWETGRKTPRGLALQKILSMLGGAVDEIPDSPRRPETPARRRGRPPLRNGKKPRQPRIVRPSSAIEEIVGGESANYDLPEHLL